MTSERVDDVNLGYVRDLLDQYLASPESVDPEWRELFEHAENGLVDGHPAVHRLMELAGAVAVERPAPAEPAAAAPAERVEAEPPAAPEPSDVLLGAVAAAMALVKAHRMHGHLAAHLDPLGSEPPGDPALDPENLIPRLTPELQSQVPARVLRVAVPGATLADVLPRLRETYCGTLAYEIEHISSHERRVWLRQVIESGTYREPLPAEAKRHLLERLCEVEGFERYLHRAFIGQKQFSIEGLDVLVPMLDETLELAAASGARQVVLGMAHRGRLNVLAHVLGRPFEQLLREFEGEREIGAVTHKPEEGTGDVKYHLGASADRQTSSGEVHVVLASNPSHLEAVDPVVEGLTRADQTDHGGPAGAHDPTRALAVLIHGDAAFPAQGVVAETLNLQGVDGYATGGTLHVIANNQVGFTTDPEEGRSTRYSSDLAKGFDSPIIHVNADDPEGGGRGDPAGACLPRALPARRGRRSDRLPALRPQRAGRGGVHAAPHGEGDREPSAGPPDLRPRARRAGNRAGRRGAGAGRGRRGAAQAVSRGAQGRARGAGARPAEAGPRSPRSTSHRRRRGRAPSPERAAADRPRRLHDPPEARTPAGASPGDPRPRRRHRLGPSRGARVREPDRRGVPSGSRAGLRRGTFTHRHLVLHDFDTGEATRRCSTCPARRHRSRSTTRPLSEFAVLGFEYGY